METGQTWEGYIRWQIIPVRRNKIKLIKKGKRLLRQLEPDNPVRYLIVISTMSAVSTNLVPRAFILGTRCFAGLWCKSPNFSNCNILLARLIDFCNAKVPVACFSEPQTTPGPQGGNHPLEKFYGTHCCGINGALRYHR